jgi:hypothetical protein
MEEYQMPEKKPSYTDYVHQVVQESVDPLPFTEIFRRVNDLSPITTRDPENTIRNSISQSHLILNTGDGRYGWKYRLINGSLLRLPLAESDLAQRRIVYTDEIQDILWPAFFEIQKRSDRSPVNVRLPDGKNIEFTLVFFSKATWGTQSTPEFWDWLKKVGARPGDELFFRVINGEAHQYAVEFFKHADRDEAAIAERNRQIHEVVRAFSQRKRFAIALWDITPFLLATGQYKHPVPPDPLEQVLQDLLEGPDLPVSSTLGGWMISKDLEMDPLIASLLEQANKSLRRKRIRQESAQPARPDQIYQLKVTLNDSHPPIWRRIQVPADICLPELHAVLQIVMGWSNSHLHGYRVGRQYYSEPDPNLEEMMDDTLDERRIRLSQIAPDTGSRFIYEYDFGDSWEHTVVVEKILPLDADEHYPRCLTGKRACPPDDVGGMGGYYDFLEVVQDPEDPEHDEMVAWYGGKFNPEYFDLQRVNDLL